MFQPHWTVKKGSVQLPVIDEETVHHFIDESMLKHLLQLLSVCERECDSLSVCVLHILLHICSPPCFLTLLRTFSAPSEKHLYNVQFKDLNQQTAFCLCDFNAS